MLDGSQLPEIPEAVARRFLDALVHERPPVYTQGVSETAKRRIAAVVGELEYADPSLFARRPHGDANARRHVRFLAALLPATVPDWRVPIEVCGVISNDNLTVSMVAEILDGEGVGGELGGETSGYRLREVALALKDGESQRSITTRLGMRRQVVTDVSTWMELSKAQADTLADAAADCVDEVIGHAPDGCVEHSTCLKDAATWLADAVRVSRDTAIRLLAQAEAALYAPVAA